ncbi:SGNH hydrolase-type esterase superfamily protein [Trifolium repens]|nr:SGNH hydrolase-type esterase superfamily protein [Trifolium repens]
MRRPQICLFGDSITEQSFDVGGWGASLANHFSRTADVVLRGYSGYNTRWVLKVLDRVFPVSQNLDGGRDEHFNRLSWINHNQIYIQF